MELGNTIGPIREMSWDSLAGLCRLCFGRQQPSLFASTGLETQGEINLVLAFQPADYPRRIVVALDMALKAARAYFDTGRIRDSEDWTLDHRTVDA
jgi:hypothetical protein